MPAATLEAPDFRMTNTAIHARQDLAYSMRNRGMSHEFIMQEIGYKSMSSVYRAISAGQKRAQMNENRVSQRKFGVEIEFNRTSQPAARRGIEKIDPEIPVVIEGYNHHVREHWKLITDASVRGTGTGNSPYGCDECPEEHDDFSAENSECYCDCHDSYGGGQGLEIVSPILDGRDGFRQLERVMKGIRKAGGGVDRSCGLHVHHDARDMSANQLAYMLDFYITHQSLIDQMLAPSRRSSNSNQWCRPYTANEKTSVVRQAKASELRDSHWDRYKTVNVTSYGRYGSIEFRQHQGTLNYSKLSAWIRFGQSLMEAAIKNGVERDAEVPAFANLEEMLAHLVADGNLPVTTKKYLTARAAAYAGA